MIKVGDRVVVPCPVEQREPWEDWTPDREGHVLVVAPPYCIIAVDIMGDGYNTERVTYKLDQVRKV